MEGVRVGEIETEEEAALVWERMSDEPGNWYARFETFRLLGPARTVAEAHRQCAREEGRCTDHVAGDWNGNIQKWRWRERAEAWDQVEQEKIRVRDSQRRTQAHEQRLSMFNVLLGVVFTALPQTLFSASFTHLSAKTVSILATLLPFYGAFWGYLIHKELVTVRTAVGGAMILACIIYETARSVRD